MVEPSADYAEKQKFIKSALNALFCGKKGIGIVLFARKNDQFFFGIRQSIRIEIADYKVGRNR